MNKIILLPLSLVLALMFSCGSQESNQEIGLQLYSLRNEIPEDVAGTHAMINDWGINEVEGGGTYDMSMEDYKALLKKNNLKMVSIGADFNELAENPSAVAEKAKSFGAKYVMCAWVPHQGTDFTLEDADKAIKVFNEAGKVLAESGIQLCYHAHGYEFRPHESGTLFDYMAENMNPDYANFEMDVFWIKHPGHDPVELLKKYPGRFPLMHLKDREKGTEGNQFGTADVETNVVLGTGDVGIGEIMKVASEYGVKHFFIEDESSHSVEQIPQSLKFLKSID